MWGYIVRRILINIPVFLGILLVVFIALRSGPPPEDAYLGKHSSEEQKRLFREKAGLDKPLLVQYGTFVWNVVRLDFEAESWDHRGKRVIDKLKDAVMPTLWLTVPSLIITTILAISIGLISSFYRGRLPDRILMLIAVLGMCISYLVYIIFGQYWGASLLNEAIAPRKLFEIEGYEPGISNWFRFCMLPVMINVIVALGYDTRYYRAVMVEECNRDYITTAVAKGASTRKVMFVHMLKNAMIPIITRIMITLPFLIAGSLLIEYYFNIPGMGRVLISSIHSKDFPVVEVFTAIFAVVFIATNILTDVLYALVDPRVRLQ
ncbi:MAG: ABC transporter permease [Planctomycetota bacterium]